MNYNLLKFYIIDVDVSKTEYVNIDIYDII